MITSKSKRKKGVTLKDVADSIGVSVMTVSNVVNGWPMVSDEMREKVQEAIDALGYRPSALARSLVTGKSLTVGIVIPDISNPYFGQVIRGCEDVLSAEGYNLFLANTDEDPEKEKYSLGMLISRGVDAIIIHGARTNCDELYRLVGDDMPLIAVDSPMPQVCGNSTYVTVDEIAGAQVATQHLLEQGHRVIGHLACPPERRLTAQQRLEGYRLALENSQIAFDPGLVVEGKPSIRGGYQAARQLLKAQNPTALFCYNDLMAIGAIIAIQQSGWHVPQDIGVVGFDDIFTASLVVPALTTMRIRQYELGKLTSELLLKRISQPSLPADVVTFPVELIVRESCGALKMTPEEKQQMMENLVTSLAVDLPNSSDTGT